MILREISKVAKQRAREFPVLTITGPRQSGKTTLVKACFPGYGYVNLEDPETRDLAENDYHRFFSIHKAPLIIDEIQRVPRLASAIQTMVDERRTVPGQYILTGSHQPVLKQTVTQSLAGRSAFLELLPLTFAEISKGASGMKTDPDSLILRGTMPELATSRMEASVYYRNYLNSYVERDVRLLTNIRNATAFNKFITLLAGRTGQLLNLNSLSCEVGVSHTILGEWIDVLEASFIVFRLCPYYANIGKRLVKTPKIYFTETGLAAYLLGLRNVRQVAHDPLRGNLFENLVVSEMMKRVKNADTGDELFFFRTSDGIEVDVLVRTDNGFRPVEIKSTMTYSVSLESGLRRFMALQPQSISPTVVYGGRSMPAGESGIEFRNFLMM
ncbi:MAG: ATP-binding protein [Kiritimatiellae bacterium]|nr:ATP-binding protein [Kiritimatiellia bacterium]